MSTNRADRTSACCCLPSFWAEELEVLEEVEELVLEEVLEELPPLPEGLERGEEGSE